MGFTAIVSGIFAIAKAIPLVYKGVASLCEMYIKNELAKIQANNTSIYNQKLVLAKKINETKDPYEKATILTTYNNL